MGITIIGLLLGLGIAIFFGVKKKPVLALVLAILVSTTPFVIALSELEQYGETKLLSTHVLQVFELNEVQKLKSSEYVFWDDEYVYLLGEGKVEIVDINNSTNNNFKRLAKAEIIIGDYEKSYMEMYLTEVESNFLSLGGYCVGSYKFYIAEGDIRS